AACSGLVGRRRGLWETRRCSRLSLVWFFFFQAEDGIRDKLVTGVQTCALPICPTHGWCMSSSKQPASRTTVRRCARSPTACSGRSEERRVANDGAGRRRAYRGNETQLSPAAVVRLAQAR